LEQEISRTGLGHSDDVGSGQRFESVILHDREVYRDGIRDNILEQEISRTGLGHPDISSGVVNGSNPLFSTTERYTAMVYGITYWNRKSAVRGWGIPTMSGVANGSNPLFSTVSSVYRTYFYKGMAFTVERTFFDILEEEKRHTI
jgi:hypothetical protein